MTDTHLDKALSQLETLSKRLEEAQNTDEAEYIEEVQLMAYLNGIEYEIKMHNDDKANAAFKEEGKL